MPQGADRFDATRPLWACPLTRSQLTLYACRSVVFCVFVAADFSLCELGGNRGLATSGSLDGKVDGNRGLAPSG